MILVHYFKYTFSFSKIKLLTNMSDLFLHEDPHLLQWECDFLYFSICCSKEQASKPVGLLEEVGKAAHWKWHWGGGVLLIWPLIYGRRNHHLQETCSRNWGHSGKRRKNSVRSLFPKKDKLCITLVIPRWMSLKDIQTGSY